MYFPAVHGGMVQFVVVLCTVQERLAVCEDVHTSALNWAVFAKQVVMDVALLFMNMCVAAFPCRLLVDMEVERSVNATDDVLLRFHTSCKEAVGELENTSKLPLATFMRVCVPVPVALFRTMTPPVPDMYTATLAEAMFMMGVDTATLFVKL